MGFSAMLYRRPALVSSASSKHSGSSEPKTLSPVNSNSSHPSRIPGIPDALSFDKIIAGGTCPVCITFFQLSLRSLKGNLSALSGLSLDVGWMFQPPSGVSIIGDLLAERFHISQSHQTAFQLTFVPSISQ